MDSLVLKNNRLVAQLAEVVAARDSAQQIIVRIQDVLNSIRDRSVTLADTAGVLESIATIMDDFDQVPKESMPPASRRELIVKSTHQLAASLLYYDRKEDDELPVGEIQNAINGGLITPWEIVAEFGTALMEGLG